MDWLKGKGIQFATSSAIRAAEQIPGEMLKNLANLNQGQALATRTPTGALLIFVIAVRDEPVDRVKARSSIENYLLNQARNERRTEEIKRLRENAAIEYVGDFAPPATDAAAPAAQNQQAAPPAAPESKEDAVRSVIEQGAAKLR
jgi:hypothetical protein